ncbi:hypothetical protein [uncultured Lacinutrix sp.]|uniref:hypothetical protein n=1 Tax=uncultured Lacinutrix sp. TaxID=574032 RepID=UPI002615A94F|nr:hypothetical protein [uncultured Lacinutrix sp.]
MINNKLNIISKIVTLLLLVAIATPTAIKLAHVFEDHKHEVCNNHSTFHFHQNETECELHKFKLNNPLNFAVQNFELFSSEIPSENIVSQYHFVSNYQRLSFSLRGPPILV